MRHRVPAWLSTATAAFMAVPAGHAAPPPGPEAPRAVAPRVFSAVEVVRKVPQGYLVTPTALIPFAAEARDERGLQRVAYVVTAARLDVGGKAGPEGKEQTVPVAGVNELLQRGTVREVHIAPDDASSALDLSKLSHLFRAPDPDLPPCRYRLRVWLEATAAGAHAGRSEPITFVVVSEFEFLSEVANEEELLQLTLEDRVADRLRRAKRDLDRLNERLATARTEQFPDLHWRANDVAAAVTRATESVQDVRTDFRRIALELRANRVRADMIERVEKAICVPLDESLRKEFPRVNEALGELTKRLDGIDADQARKAGAAAGGQLDALIARIGKAIAAARDLEKANRQIRSELKTREDIERLLWPPQ
jgi:hypothetical protein